MNLSNKPRYAGFWLRILATVIDSFMLLAVTLPLLLWVYGWDYLGSSSAIRGPVDFLVSWVLPAVAAVAFWRYRSATPGKMIVSAWIVDAQTGQQPSLAQCIIRYFAYILSAAPLGLGFLWIAFDPRKQAWHDKLAGTVVTWGHWAVMPAETAEAAATEAARPAPLPERPSPWADESFDLSDPLFRWPEEEAVVQETASHYAFPGVTFPDMILEEPSVAAE
jgi:uncharacterized RDD family membrane protein YckC